MTTHQQLEFSNDLELATSAIDAIAAGRGWCNVSPVARDDEPALTVTIFGLTTRHGVPVATLVTASPREGVDHPSSLGVLHPRGRLGAPRIKELFGDVPYTTRQDHSHRGLVVDVPTDVSARRLVSLMCSLTEELCDVELTGRWKLDAALRD